MSLQREVPHLRPVSIPAINCLLSLIMAGAPVSRQPVRGLPIGNGEVQHLRRADILKLTQLPLPALLQLSWTPGTAKATCLAVKGAGHWRLRLGLCG